MKILYFAWLRENVGYANEEIDLPKEIKNVSQLVNFLRKKSSGHNIALENMNTVRVAVNKEYSTLQTLVKDDDEIAFFPPVTGG